MSTTETAITPPDVDQHEEGGGGNDPDITRVAIHVIDVHDQGYDAGINLCGERAHDPDAWAEALLRIAHGIATVLGADYVWALDRRLAAHDDHAAEMLRATRELDQQTADAIERAARAERQVDRAEHTVAVLRRRIREARRMLGEHGSTALAEAVERVLHVGVRPDGASVDAGAVIEQPAGERGEA